MAQALILVDFSIGTATVLLSVLLAVLFVARGLQRLYPVFFCYWIFDMLQSVVPFFPVTLQTGGRIQAAFVMIGWILYFLLVLELVDRILEDHPGLARLGRRVVQVVMIAAIAGAVYTLRFDSLPQAAIPDKLRLLLQLERVVSGCLLLLLLAINLFLWLFPVRLNRNTKAYCWGFTLLFLVKTIAPFLLNTRGGAFFGTADTIHMSGVLLCQVMWLFAITKRGAERTQAFPRGWSIGDQQKALSTLDSFEQQISGTRGR